MILRNEAPTIPVVIVSAEQDKQIGAFFEFPATRGERMAPTPAQGISQLLRMRRGAVLRARR